MLLQCHRIPFIGNGIWMTYSGKLEGLFDILEKADCSPDKFSHRHWMAKNDAIAILAKFGIPAPSEKENTTTVWLHFLILIVQTSKRGDLKAARNMMSNPDLRFTRRLAPRKLAPEE